VGILVKNKLTTNEATSDYEICFDALYDYVDYFVVNVSSPIHQFACLAGQGTINSTAANTSK
jgi:dihydroorotate dehydrogenase